MQSTKQAIEYKFNELLQIMARLRHPDKGCPWDLEQDFASIAPYTIEEAYEVADAIDRKDMNDLRDELGDLLLQVVFHAQMASELTDDQHRFDIQDVLQSINDKLIRRHPHVFPPPHMLEDRNIGVNGDGAAITTSWEDIKASERALKNSEKLSPVSVLDGVAISLPALLRAEKLQKRAARVGFDWPDWTDVLNKLDEEVQEIRDEMAITPPDKDRVLDEVGDLLFVGANLARKLGVDPELALKHANSKFEKRFMAVEQKLASKQKPISESSLEEMENLWQEVKKEQRSEQ